jgi:hypothetical protein
MYKKCNNKKKDNSSNIGMMKLKHLEHIIATNKKKQLKHLATIVETQ